MKNLQINQWANQQFVPAKGDIIIPLGGFDIGKPATIDRFYENEIGAIQVSFGFNVRTQKKQGDFQSVCCSGGPFESTNHLNLTHVGKAENRFWDWKDGTMGAGNGYEYTEEVNVWCYTPLHDDPKVSINRCCASFSELKDQLSFYGEQYERFHEEVNGPRMQTSGLDCYRVCRGARVIKEKLGQYDNGFHTDVIGEAIFEAYRTNKKIALTEHDEPIGCGYLYSTGKGWALRDKAELDAVIDAYNLTVSEERGHYGQLLLIPNINVCEWKPLTIEQVTIEKSA